MNLHLHLEARAELREAVEYYNDRESGLGREFLHEVRGVAGCIRTDPEAWPIFDGPTRIARLKRFHSYGIVFSIEGDEIFIHAVMHLSRKPGYWKKRLREKPKDTR